MRKLLPLVLCLALAGCGAGSERVAKKPESCPNGQSSQAIRRLRADVETIRASARGLTKDTLKGNATVNAATDRFLVDIAKAQVDLLVKNRFIDHAAAALAGSCQQGFQALEAERPIPAISHGGRCAT